MLSHFTAEGITLLNNLPNVTHFLVGLGREPALTTALSCLLAVSTQEPSYSRVILVLKANLLSQDEPKISSFILHNILFYHHS